MLFGSMLVFAAGGFALIYLADCETGGMACCGRPGTACPHEFAEGSNDAMYSTCMLQLTWILVV